MTLYFITSNEGKLQEVQRLLGDVEGLNIDLPEVQSLDACEIVSLKLEEAQKHYEGELIVEDTSLYCEGMRGLPGPLIKWFLYTVGNEGLYAMVDVFQNKKAEAKTVVGYVGSDGTISFFEGAVKGIVVEPRGGGFGWDSIFLPEGHKKTFGEMTSEEKDAISMRSIALKKLKAHIDTKKGT